MDNSVVMWIVVILLLVILVGVFGYIFYSLFGRGEALPPVDKHDVIASNAAAIAEGRYGDIRFELVPRGYRQEQVDAAVEELLRATGAQRKIL